MSNPLCSCGHPHHEGRCTKFEVVRPGKEQPCSCTAWTKPVENVTRHDQPPPTAFDSMKPAIWPLVMVDMCERDHVGRARYGTPLQPNNGRDALRDAYAEALDLAVYLRQAIYERDSK